MVLVIPGARSLKDKRRALSQVRDRLKNKGLAFAEVGHRQDHRRAVVAISVVGSEASVLRSLLDSTASQVASWRAALVESVDVQLIRPYDGGTEFDHQGYDPADV